MSTDGEKRWSATYVRSLIEASPDPLVTISAEGKVTDVNEATVKVTGVERGKLIGTDFSDYFTEPERARLGYEKVFAEGAVTDYPLTIQHRDGRLTDVLYNASVYRDAEGKVLGVFAAARDITERKRNEAINEARLHLIRFSLTHSLDELLEETLNASEKLTGSLIGFYHFVEDDQVSLTLQNWSARTKAEFCKAEGKGLHYPIDKAGVWVDCVNQGKPVIHNDYAALPNRKGLPEGHAAVIRELVVPVFRGGKITAILGVGNKPSDYTDEDIKTVSLIADLAWEIAERKKVEETLRESQARYMRLFNAGNDAIFVHRVGDDAAPLHFLEVNDVACQRLGYSREELLRLSPQDIDAPEMEASRDAAVRELNSKGRTVFEMEHVARDGGRIPVEISAHVFDLGGQPICLSIARDITERKQADAALRDSYRKIKRARNEWNHAFDAVSDPLFLHDREGRITRCNRAYVEQTGLPFEEIIGRHYWEVFPKGDVPLVSCLQEVEGEQLDMEEEIVLEDGKTFLSRNFSARGSDGEYLFSIHAMADITERKRKEDVIRASEERYRSLFENMISGYAHCKMIYENGEPQDFIYLTVNRAFETLTGLQGVVGKRVSEVIPGVRESNPELLEIYGGVAMTGKPQRFETYLPILDIWFDVTVYCPEKGYFIAVFDNVNARKRTEEELNRLNRVLQTLSEGNRAMLHAGDETELMHSICRVITASSGYVLSWIGLLSEEEGSIDPVAIVGAGDSYVEGLRLRMDAPSHGCNPVAAALSSGQIQIVQDIMQDPRYASWREAATRYGYASLIVLPLKENDKVFGTLNIYAPGHSAFSDSEVELLEQMAADLSFGIATLRTRDERDRVVEENQKYAERLRDSLEGALQAVAATVEMRDPYTAGHQRRVADLAAAIAQEMGLPEEQVHGIHLAGFVHDIGKVSIPAEILSKPGRLTEVEYELIKAHSQAGYDILKGIEFPWPIAQAVLQHHERLDGSGYPQGLKGDEILLEARILAVADVIEAMSSHRPYRPGLGLELALNEITSKRGILFDPVAVDNCLTLFREGRFTLRFDS